MARIKVEMMRLRIRKIGLLKHTTKLELLEAEAREIVRIIKEIQTDYFDKKKIPYETYIQLSREYKKRFIELRKSIEVLRERERKRRVKLVKEKWKKTKPLKFSTKEAVINS